MNIIRNFPDVKIIGDDLKRALLKWFEYKTTAQEGMQELFCGLGVSEKDIIFLDNYNASEKTFDVESRIDGKYKIRLESGVENNYQRFTLIASHSEHTYYHVYSEFNGADVSLNNYYYENKQNGNKCYANANHSSLFTTIMLENGYDNLIINALGTPKIKRYLSPDMYEYKFGLENIDILEEKLLQLEFPLEIEEVYKLISDTCIKEPARCSKIVLMINNLNTVPALTDKMVVERGELIELITTKKGKRIAFNNDGNWEFENADMSASHTDGKYNYSLHSMDEESIANRTSQMDELMALETCFELFKEQMDSEIKRKRK